MLLRYDTRPQSLLSPTMLPTPHASLFFWGAFLVDGVRLDDFALAFLIDTCLGLCCGVDRTMCGSYRFVAIEKSGFFADRLARLRLYDAILGHHHKTMKRAVERICVPAARSRSRTAIASYSSQYSRKASPPVT